MDNNHSGYTGSGFVDNWYTGAADTFLVFQEGYRPVEFTMLSQHYCLVAQAKLKPVEVANLAEVLHLAVIQR